MLENTKWWLNASTAAFIIGSIPALYTTMMGLAEWRHNDLYNSHPDHDWIPRIEPYFLHSLMTSPPVPK